MTARQITAMFAALALGAGVAAGCGEDDERSQEPAPGSPTTVETGANTIGSTGTQTTKTQGGSPGY
jgi:hypothetical protein